MLESRALLTFFTVNAFAIGAVLLGVSTRDFARMAATSHSSRRLFLLPEDDVFVMSFKPALTCVRFFFSCPSSIIIFSFVGLGFSDVCFGGTNKRERENNRPNARAPQQNIWCIICYPGGYFIFP